MGRRNSETRREAILEAALREFSAKGYACARMEDIAQRAGVAKGTLYLYFRDKEGLFQGLAESVLIPMRARVRAIIADEGLSLREKLLHVYEPLLKDGGCSRTAEIIRVVWAEGLHNPALVIPFFHTLVVPIMDLHRENVRHAAKEKPHPSLLDFPQLLMGPVIHGLLWQGMLKDTAPLDVEAMYRAYLDMILPEKSPKEEPGSAAPLDDGGGK